METITQKWSPVLKETKRWKWLLDNNTTSHSISPSSHPFRSDFPPLHFWSPFLKRLRNFSGPKANFIIKTCWIVAEFQAHNPVNFASLTDSFIASLSKFETLISNTNMANRKLTAFRARKATGTFENQAPGSHHFSPSFHPFCLYTNLLSPCFTLLPWFPTISLLVPTAPVLIPRHFVSSSLPFCPDSPPLLSWFPSLFLLLPLSSFQVFPFFSYLNIASFL